MVGDDTLVLSLAGKLHIAKLQGGCILSQLSFAPSTCLHSQMGLVVDICVVEDFVVLLPSKRHGRITGAGCRADERHIGALEGRLGFWLHCDLRLREVICEK